MEEFHHRGSQESRQGDVAFLDNAGSEYFEGLVVIAGELRVWEAGWCTARRIVEE